MKRLNFLTKFHLGSALSGAALSGFVVYLIATQNSALSPAPQAFAAGERTTGAASLSPLMDRTVAGAGMPQISGNAEGLNLAALERPGLIDATNAGQVKLAALTPLVTTRTISIAKGDTLMKLLVKAGAARNQAHAAVTAMSKVYDPRRLRVGQELSLTFRSNDGEEKASPDLINIRFDPSPERSVIASLGGDGYDARDVKHELETRQHSAEAVIEDSLFLAAERAGIPAGVIIDLIHIYSFDVDFQRDIQPGDRFEVFYETVYTEKGEKVRNGDILYAKLKVRNTELPLYHFKMKNGDVDYFNDKGHSVRKALMKTPVDGARISSRFGKRRHPILGYNKMHRGLDFAAPRGTPIMAAGNGTVEYAGRNGAYGNYIRIRHNSDYKTAYAHLHKFANGTRKGKRVKQGQIIGYVGSTGRSTGNHLHYEILRNGRQVNPLGLKLPTGKKLTGAELAEFKTRRQEIRTAYDNSRPSRLASNQEN